MLRMYAVGCSWGIEPVDDGVQVNILNGESPKDPNAIVIGIPFTGDSFMQLIKGLAEHMTPEQKMEVSSLFMGGIVLPDGKNTPSDLHSGKVAEIRERRPPKK